MRAMPYVVLISILTALALVGDAFAGESYRGSIIIADGGLRHNYSSCTECAPAANPDGGAPFSVTCPAASQDGGCWSLNGNSKLTLQCDADAYVLTDVLTFATSGVGVRPLKVTSGTLYPTSTNTQIRVSYVIYPDGGTTIDRTSTIVVKPVTGSSLTCNVWERTGQEY